MLPIFEFYIDNLTGVSKMSLVDEPAVEVDFLHFNKEEVEMKFTIDDEQRIVFGVAMRADYPIYRRDNKYGEYYIQFSKETVKACAEKFLIEKHNEDVNTNHSTDVKGVHLIYSFIKDSDKGLSPKGFEEIEEGSWFTAYKVDNDDVWNKVKNGEFNGFSVEVNGFIEEVKEVDEIDEFVNQLLN